MGVPRSAEDGDGQEGVNPKLFRKSRRGGARRRLGLNYEYRAGKINNREWNERLFGRGG
ncbi:hypothetical protein [Rhizobium sp. 007]|uniref:hypothetical protein n=1 Tax=Rhizobium sp. 007 TaxID=2785056 RepID=UPI00188E187C|nr:hypothetical protein [Rhizobium sp. 007]QPB24335.1 hypothetical protein ISN39_32790 [Rhizobium sp. 007]